MHGLLPSCEAVTSPNLHFFIWKQPFLMFFVFFFANEHKKGNDGIKCKLTAFINKLFTFNISSPQTAWSMRTQLKVNICINKWLFATTKSLTYSDAHIKNFRQQSNRLVQTAYPRATQLVHPYMHDHTAHFSWNMLLHWEQRHNETISVCILKMWSAVFCPAPAFHSVATLNQF